MLSADPKLQIETASEAEAKHAFEMLSADLMLQITTATEAVTAQGSAAKGDGKDAAFRALKTFAGRHHSLRMAAMAAMVQTATKGNFDAAITAVDKMLAELRQEEMDDITLRDYCQAQEVKVEGEIEDNIDRLNAKKSETAADIKQTETAIADGGRDGRGPLQQEQRERGLQGDAQGRHQGG